MVQIDKVDAYADYFDFTTSSDDFDFSIDTSVNIDLDAALALDPVIDLTNFDTSSSASGTGFAEAGFSASASTSGSGYVSIGGSVSAGVGNDGTSFATVDVGVDASPNAIISGSGFASAGDSFDSFIFDFG